MFPRPISSILLIWILLFTYPEVQVQVSTSTKLPVANLEGDGHPVVGVQHFVEALARVSPKLHVVRECEHNAGKQHQQRIEDGRHDCGVAADRWLGVVVVKMNATASSLGVEGGLCLSVSGGEPALLCKMCRPLLLSYLSDVSAACFIS